MQNKTNSHYILSGNRTIQTNFSAKCTVHPSGERSDLMGHHDNVHIAENFEFE